MSLLTTTNTPGKTTLAAYPAGNLTSGARVNFVESPTAPGLYQVEVDPNVARLWYLFDNPSNPVDYSTAKELFDVGPTTTTSPSVPPSSADPSTKALKKSIDGQSVENHNLKDLIEWEKHQGAKAAGGWGAVGFGGVRQGGPFPRDK
jgi:hypothetical protein